MFCIFDKGREAKCEVCWELGEGCVRTPSTAQDGSEMHPDRLGRGRVEVEQQG